MWFSDEKKWNLDGSDGYHYYWHDLRKDPQLFKKRVQGGRSIMTWGAFCANGQTELKIICGRLNSKRYQELVESTLIPFGPVFAGDNWQFQQDNAPVHVSKSTKAWFDSKNVRVIKWPALSPDLNPIENIWGVMARMVYSNGRQYDSIETLTIAVRDAWEEVTSEYRHSLVDGMGRRCVEVLKRNGRTIDH